MEVGSSNGVGEVGLEELGHAEGPDLVLAEDGFHLLVGLEELLVLGVLELVLLDVGPQPLHHLGSRQLLALLGSDEGAEVLGEVQRLRESASLGHGGGRSVVYRSIVESVYYRRRRAAI